MFYGLYGLDIPIETKNIASLATLFLVPSTFTVAKTVRDTQLASLLEKRVAGAALLPQALLRGTSAWRLQVPPIPAPAERVAVSPKRSLQHH